MRGRVGPDDVIQDAFLDAAGRLAGYLLAPGVPVSVWLRGLVVQRLLTAQRAHLAVKGRAVTREVAADGHAVADSMAGLLVGGLTSPTAAAVCREQHDRVRAALAGMDPLDREVLALRHFEELSNADAAAVLGLTTSAASKRHVRALRRLKEVLGDPDASAGGKLPP